MLSAVICRRTSVLKSRLLYCPMLTKTKNIHKKMFFFSKIKKKVEGMAQGKQQPKFETNPCIRFRDNCDTEGRTDDDRRRTNFDFMSSADIVKRS